MTLASLQLEAFFAVARLSSFTRAARELHLTQSALSQRIKNLEQELAQLLFVRGPGGVALTDAGVRLERYCRAQASLQSELLGDLGVDGDAHVTTLRIAGFSSVMRSAVTPAIGPVLRALPKLQVEIMSRELSELPALLSRGAAELVLLDHPHDMVGVERVHLGDEHYVLVESTMHDERGDVYLDHDPEDATTERFLRKNKRRRAQLVRSYFDDVYGVIDGAAHGLGRAVVPRHLLGKREHLRVVAGLEPLRVPVYLHWWRLPMYSSAHLALRDALVREVPRALRA